MKLLATFPPMPRKDAAQHRRFYTDTAMTHPGRMRVALAMEALKFLCPKADRSSCRVGDIFVGVGTTIIAAAELGFHSIVGVDIDGRWVIQTVNLVQEHFPEIYCTIAHTNADNLHKSSVVESESLDLILCSPEFANAHSQGKSKMQQGLRKHKQTVAGTEYGSGLNWRGEKRYRLRLTAALNGSRFALKMERRIAIHTKQYVEKNIIQKADEWTADCLEEAGFEVEGYIAVPLGYRSKYQEDQRLFLRKIVSRNEDALEEVLECGHLKTRSEPPEVWPKKARCVECGPDPKRVEVREERIIVARRVR